MWDMDEASIHFRGVLAYTWDVPSQSWKIAIWRNP